MEGLQVDFDQLVHETYAFGEESASSLHSPGLFYSISWQTYTYQIEAVVSRDIGREEGKGKHYFATPTVELAQVIADSVASKRFPRREAICYNIGDPVENWWMAREDNSLKIFFRSHGLQYKKIRLGPLGDSGVAVARFRHLETHLKRGIPLSLVEISPKMIHFVTLRSEEGEVPGEFVELQDLLQKGKLPRHLLGKLNQRDFPTIFHYLNELAVIRHFWMGIIRQIGEGD